MTRRRRRRNPSATGVVETLAVAAALGAVAYIIYKFSSGASTVAKAVSNSLVPYPTSTAKIVMPDGSSIPYDSVKMDPFYTHWSGEYFTYTDGLHYMLQSGPDENNTYYAALDPSQLQPITVTAQPIAVPATDIYGNPIDSTPIA